MYIVASVVGCLVLLNIIASYVVLTTYFAVKSRRYYQITFVWFAPIIGAILAIYLNREDRFEVEHKRQIGNHSNISDSEAVNHAMASDYHGGR